MTDLRASLAPLTGWVSGIGAWFRSLPKPMRFLVLVLVALFFYVLPLLQPPLITTTAISFSGVLFDASIYALVAVGLNIVIGYAGLLDLGYVGFYATGAYVVGVMTEYHWHWPFFFVLPFAILITMGTGVLLGAPTLRVRGDYLAIVTLGFGEIIRLTAINVEWLGAARGISGIPHPPSVGPNPPGGDPATHGLFVIPRLDWNGLVPSLDFAHGTSFLTFGAIDPTPYYWLVLSFLILVLFGDRLVKDSRVGRAWEATREDEEAAELMGVPTFKFKLLAFAMGAMVGGLAGSFKASGQGSHIEPQTFILLYSVLFVAAVILGGAGNRWGVIVGAVLVVYLPERFRAVQDFRFFVFGLALIALTIFRPQGLLPPRRTVRARRAEEEIQHLEAGDDVAKGVQ